MQANLTDQEKNNQMLNYISGLNDLFIKQQNL